MLKKTAERRIDMILLDKDGTLKVKDTGKFWTEEYEWRYNPCLTFEENEKILLQILYNDSQVDYCVSEKFMQYLENRKKLSENLGHYENLVKSIRNIPESIPSHIKNELFEVINSDIFSKNPYI